MSVFDQMLDEADQADQVAPVTASGSCSFQIELKKFVLLALLDKAAAVIPSKDLMPVLKNFQIEATPYVLRVVATDMELSVISVTSMVTVKQAGVCVFPATKLMSIVREANDGTVTISVTDNKARITVDRASWDLRLQSGVDYPSMPDLDSVKYSDIDRLKFANAIHSVRYAAAKDVNRPSLMMIHVGDNKMTACDGTRLQQASLEDFPLSLQLPTGAIDDLLKLIKSTDMTEIMVGETDSHLVFKIGPDVFLINRLMAQFPDVEALLLRPALANKQKLIVDRSELVEAVKRVRINADPETSAVGLYLSAGKVLVTSRDKHDNGAQEELVAEWQGNDRLLVVNHTYLTEMLSMYDGASCCFLLGDDTKSRKSPLMLKNETLVGIVQQMYASNV